MYNNLNACGIIYMLLTCYCYIDIVCKLSLNNNYK